MSSIPTSEPTLNDIFQAILAIDARTDIAFTRLQHKVQSLDERQTETLEAIHAFSSEVDNRFDKTEKRISHIETRMITKDYLDDKLFALRADLIQLAKRADKRLDQLIEELVSEKSLKRATADRLLAMGS